LTVVPGPSPSSGRKNCSSEAKEIFPPIPFSDIGSGSRRSTPVPLLTRQERGSINVNRVHVTGLAASSILHIGSNEQTRLESRIKHIRQLESEDKKNGNGEIFIK